MCTPLLTEDTRRQACIQHGGRCCNCGSTEHNLRWRPAHFHNVFSLLNPELATHDPDGSVFERWKKKMRNWRRKGPQRRHQGNVRRHTSGNGPSRPHNSEPHPTPQGNNTGTMPASSAAAPQAQPLAPPAASTIPQPAAPGMRYGPTFSTNHNPNARQPGTFGVQPAANP